MKAPMRLVIERRGQPYVDQGVYAMPREPSRIGVEVRELFNAPPRVPRLGLTRDEYAAAIRSTGWRPPRRPPRLFTGIYDRMPLIWKNPEGTKPCR